MIQNKNQFISHILEEVASSSIYRLDEAVDELTAWHNTNAKFDQFDTSFIGNGCGSQYYGWGVYVSTDPDVTAGYRDWFGSIKQKRPVEGTAKYGSYEYEVEIPDDDGTNYVEWDGPAIYVEGFDGFNSFAEQYKAMSEVLGSQKAASMEVYELGYIGIKVAGYRNTGGNGLPNYVIFNPDKDLKIIKRNDYESEWHEDDLGFGFIRQIRYDNKGMRLIGPDGNVIVEGDDIIAIAFDTSVNRYISILHHKGDAKWEQVFDIEKYKFIEPGVHFTEIYIPTTGDKGSLITLKNTENIFAMMTLYDADQEQIVPGCQDCDSIYNVPNNSQLLVIAKSMNRKGTVGILDISTKQFVIEPGYIKMVTEYCSENYLPCYVWYGNEVVCNIYDVRAHSWLLSEKETLPFIAIYRISRGANNYKLELRKRGWSGHILFDEKTGKFEKDEESV